MKEILKLIMNFIFKYLSIIYDWISAKWEESKLLKRIVILIYIIAPPISQLLIGGSFKEYFFTDFLSYEIFWYIYGALFLITPHKIKNYCEKCGLKIQKKVKYESLTNTQYKIRLFLFYC